MGNKEIVHTLIAFLAFEVGYPLIGTAFIVCMLPYVIYLCIQKDGKYLPALVLHAASGTSIMIAIAVTSVYMGFKNYNVLPETVKRTFVLMCTLMPIFLYLMYQRVIYDGDNISLSFMYTNFYWGVFVFFYGVLISNRFSDENAKSTFMVLMIAYILRLIGFEYGRILGVTIFLSIGLLFLNFYKQIALSRRLTIVSLGIVCVYIYSMDESTFTVLGTIVFMCAIIRMYMHGNTKGILKITGIIPFLLIFALYIWGITQYLDMNNALAGREETLNIMDPVALWHRLQFKIFEDRAPFWAGAFSQVMEYKPILPIHDMPVITACMIDGRDVEADFGAHTTFIAILRNYGIIAGVILGYCIIKITIMSRNVFRLPNMRPYFLLIYSIAFSYGIIGYLTGTYPVMMDCSLMTMTVMGIAYGKYTNGVI